MIAQNFIKIYEESFKKNWDLPALTDYKGGNSYTYGQRAHEIAKLHLLFSGLQIEKGDKISLVGKNHSSWSIVFMATITYGAVIVPILHEFNPESTTLLGISPTPQNLIVALNEVKPHLIITGPLVFEKKKPCSFRQTDRIFIPKRLNRS